MQATASSSANGTGILSAMISQPNQSAAAAAQQRPPHLKFMNQKAFNEATGGAASTIATMGVNDPNKMQEMAITDMGGDFAPPQAAAVLLNNQASAPTGG